ncbi:hypothetical protein HZA97_01175 [Candidatus Woesearchaeota archaeon]|nr:hypothetical protein [Candidatus Woesearchaeota archaeon]
MNQNILGDKKKTSFDENLADYVNGIFDKMPDEVPEQEVVSSDFPFSVKDLIERGNDHFYWNDEKLKNSPLIVGGSLMRCLSWVAEKNGVIASLPYLIAGLSVANKTHWLKRRFHTALSEENVGLDANGNPVIIIVHGGGILSSKIEYLIFDEYLTPQNAIKYSTGDWNNLLNGELPNGERIELYDVDDVKRGLIPDPFGRYGIVLDFDKVRNTGSEYHNKVQFLSNDLVIARAGTLEHLEQYFDSFASQKVGNWHVFNEINKINPEQSQGRMLLINQDFNGLSGVSGMNKHARFVGVPQKNNPRIDVIIEG